MIHVHDECEETAFNLGDVYVSLKGHSYFSLGLAKGHFEWQKRPFELMQ